MPKLINLDAPVVSLTGVKIVNPFKPRENLTLRAVFIAVCEFHKPQNPGSGEFLRAYKLGIKFLDAEQNQIELEQEDIDFLKRIVPETSIFVSVIIGRTLDYLESIIGQKVDKIKSN